MTPRQFARLNRYRDDPIGDFCKDLLADREFPKGQLSWARLEGYLHYRGACWQAMEAARGFWLLLKTRRARDEKVSDADFHRADELR